MPKQKLQLYSVVSTKNPKFEKYNGLPRMSYSAYTSWNEESYIGSFIAAKFLGIPDPGNIFTEFGSGCGEWLETAGEKAAALLSESDIEILSSVEVFQDSEFEREIMIKRENYCILGYIDECHRDGVQLITVTDFKTGGAKKKADYAGPDYNQTRLYAYGLEEEGEEIGYVGVELLHRKGNTLVPGDKNILRLEGTIEKIPTPYVREETEEFLEKFDKTAKEISDHLVFYNKYFKD